MEVIKEIFYFEFFNIGDFVFTPLKAIALLLIWVITQKLITLYRRFCTNLFKRNQWQDDDRLGFMRKYGTYGIVAIAMMVSFAGLGLWGIVEAFMDFTFFENREAKFKFSVGNIIVIVIIFLIAGFIARVFRLFLRKSLSKRDWIDKGKEFIILKLITYLVYIIAFVVAIESIGANLSSLLIASAALLVGVGLGLQHIFNDIVSGFILLFEGTFKVGDVIEINNGIVARVTRIDVRTSKVITQDGNFLIIPNSKLTTDIINNWSHGNLLTRFNISVRVAFGSDTIKVREILYDCAIRHPQVSKQENIVVRFADFGDSALKFELFFWANQTWLVETVKSDLRYEIDKRFREEGISIPVPQRELRMVTDPVKKDIPA
jgi:small-conductance mechanosensitive channel